MKLAIIPGFNLLVPQGKLVGGTFKSTPVCSRAGQTGCVMTWVSFREKNVPPAGAIFGVADKPGMTVACTNPARPGATGWVGARQLLVRPLGAAGARRPDPMVDRRRAAVALPPHRRAGLRPLRQGRRRAAICRSAPMPIPRTSAPTASAARSRVLGMFIPGWGMHLADMSAPMGDLIRQVSALNGAKSASGQPR